MIIVSLTDPDLTEIHIDEAWIERVFVQKFLSYLMRGKNAM